MANGEDYFTRKGGYAIHCLLTCDDVSRIRNVVVGWPGSVHDNRIWSQSKLNCNCHDFFSEKEYLLGDSAFQASAIMIPAFKKPFGGELDEYKSFFNMKLAKARIKTEHCIGVLKARWQYFKRIRVQIKGKADMKRVIKYFMCAVILHNLLIDEPIPSEWMDDPDCDVLEEDDQLNMPVTAEGARRREQLFAYILEMCR